MEVIYSKIMRKFTYTLDNDEKLEKVGNAIANPIRRRILRFIHGKSYSLLELANEMNMPVSTTSFHVKILREAGLIKMIPSPSKKGNEKNISFDCESVHIFFSGGTSVDRYNKVIDIPLGTLVPPLKKICTDSQSKEMFFSLPFFEGLGII
ncbi:MAG TPA: helix-turn-helix domain-containing protein, partial [Bacilli bacterium]|nr:helix-turn-helix domain-containing protein [Bacilli bacterium]